MTINIDTLSQTELIDLNRRIVQRLKFLESLHHHQEMLRFNVGDRVSFEPPGRGRITGILVKYNQKSVSVVTETGERWTVAPGLLSKIKPVENPQKGQTVTHLNSKRK